MLVPCRRPEVASAPMLKKSVLLFISALIAGAPAWRGTVGLSAQEDPWSRGSAGTGLLLRKLDGVKRVLMIGAHPDDEDTALLAALSRGMGIETAYLSLTRGEGGQNSLGPELDEGLGLLRTAELLAARALDGGRQFFTRAFDFGYSKSAEETFRFWPREEILADVTWVVRTFRPQIIVSAFSGTPRDGHGHHQVAGIVAHEVFVAAGDPTRFPEQIAQGAGPWTPLKLYLLTRRDPQEGTTGVETGTFDPLLGRSYYQVAMDSRSQHRSQDMGVAQPMGPRRSTVALVESRVNAEGADEIFAGVDTTVLSIAEGVPDPIREYVEDRLSEYRLAIAEARSTLDAMEPWRATPALGRAVEALGGISAVARTGENPPPYGDAADAALQWFLWERLPLVQEAFLRSAGLVWEVRVEDDLLVPGQTVNAVVELWNGGPFTLSRASGLVLTPEGWGIEGEVRGPEEVAPGTLARWSFQLHVPALAHASRAYYMAEPRAGELYRWPEDSKMWGSPGNSEILRGSLTFSVEELGGVWLDLEKGAQFRGVDKVTGEFVRPVQVFPSLSVSLDPTVMVWPTGSQAAREFTVTVRSQDEGSHTGTVSLGVPGGWKVDPIIQPLSLAEAGAEGSFSFWVTAPSLQGSGAHSIQARVQTDDGGDYREAVSLVDYPHIPRGALFAPAQSRVSLFPVAVEDRLRVGYVMGSGDSGADAIRQMGFSVELLGPETLRSGVLDGFDVVVLGIRAYETRPDLMAANDRLLDFARNGGTLIVQYNKYEYPRGGFAPYPVDMSRPHDRVSDETVPVRILSPDHPAFQFPNSITEADFDGWAQERGLYFLGSWDSNFTPLLEMADPGEEPKRGGLLVAPVGKGLYVYTGLAFFRQFPEGVPGAYRLFANLLSLKGPGVDGR
jgi:LmbE family N-acetylglucosaminyl deacetylase